MTLASLLGVLIVINLWTFACFWWDKVQAIGHRRRVAESNLLALALIGGSPGAMLARRLFNHKTRKEPFSTNLLVIIALQAGGVLGLALTLL